jgi:hypothetical protein
MAWVFSGLPRTSDVRRNRKEQAVVSAIIESQLGLSSEVQQLPQ